MSGEPDDDPLGRLVARERDELARGRPRVAGALDHPEGAGQGPGRVGDGHAGPREAVVERQDPHGGAIVPAASRSPAVPAMAFERKIQRPELMSLA